MRFARTPFHLFCPCAARESRALLRLLPSNQPTPFCRRLLLAVPSPPCPLLRGIGRGVRGGGPRFTRGGFGHLDLANLLPLASRPGGASPTAWSPLLSRSLGAPLALSGLGVPHAFALCVCPLARFARLPLSLLSLLSQVLRPRCLTRQSLARALCLLPAPFRHRPGPFPFSLTRLRAFTPLPSLSPPRIACGLPPLPLFCASLSRVA